MMEEQKLQEEVPMEEATEKSAEENPKGQSEAVGTESGKMAEKAQPEILPEGEVLYEADVTITVSVLYDYFLRHVYSSFSGMFGTIVGAFMIMVYLMKGISVLYLICGVIVILYLPCSLYLTAKRQSLQEAFKTPLHYAFYENGVEVSQNDIRQMQRWEDMVKAVSTSQSIILYTGKNAASIFPRKDLKEDSMGLIQVISTHMDAKKVKIRQ